VREAANICFELVRLLKESEKQMLTFEVLVRDIRCGGSNVEKTMDYPSDHAPSLTIFLICRVSRKAKYEPLG
jgi:hypothetical protein